MHNRNLWGLTKWLFHFLIFLTHTMLWRPKACPPKRSSSTTTCTTTPMSPTATRRWCWLVKNADGSLAVTKTENGVNPLCFGQTALLGCDVWEHSYYIDYRNKRPAYLTNFLDNLVNWENVAGRM